MAAPGLDPILLDDLVQDGMVTTQGTAATAQASDTRKDARVQPSAHKGLGFFAIIGALALTGLITSLEATITSITLPTIVTDVSGGGLPAVIYSLPVYFQAALEASPARAGTYLLPTILFMIPGAIIGGGLKSEFGRYRPLQHIGFALMVVGFGILTLLRTDSSTGAWVGLQIPSAIDTGLKLPVPLPAVQAFVTNEDTALSTLTTWSFIRSFGLIWGATIPIAAFDNRFNQLLYQIQDSTIASQLVDGQAYERATKTYMNSIADPTTRLQVQSVYVESIKTVWYVSLACSALAFVLVILQKEISLRDSINTKFGQDKPKTTTEPESRVETS